MLASEEGHKAIVEELLKANADHSISTQQGHTALMLAAGGGNKGVVELLLHQKADTSVRRVKWDAARSINKDGRTILMIACHHGHAQIVKVHTSPPYPPLTLPFLIRPWPSPLHPSSASSPSHPD